MGGGAVGGGAATGGAAASGATPRAATRRAGAARGSQAPPAQALTSALPSWAALLAELSVAGAARQLAAHSVLEARETGLVRLLLDPAQSLLRTPALIEKLAQALSAKLGESIRLEVELGSDGLETPARLEARALAAELEATRQSLEEDPTVRLFKEKLGARLKADSVKLH